MGRWVASAGWACCRHLYEEEWECHQPLVREAERHIAHSCIHSPLTESKPGPLTPLTEACDQVSLRADELASRIGGQQCCLPELQLGVRKKIEADAAVES